MYKLEFLPIAKKDMEDIIFYISNNLKNQSAAINLSQSFLKSARSILDFPYGLSEYIPTSKLTKVYRNIKIKKFLMFYTVNEKEKTITVVRVLHQRMDISNILE